MIYDRKLKNEFMKRYAVTESNTGNICIQRLIRKNCKLQNNRNICDGHCDCLPPIKDHSSLWLDIEGKPYIFLIQPYALNLKEINNLIKFCQQYKLDFIIGTWPSFHFPGQVLSIIIKKKGK